jgi:putative oxidoreductase
VIHWQGNVLGAGPSVFSADHRSVYSRRSRDRAVEKDDPQRGYKEETKMNLQYPAVSFLGRLLITYIFATSGLAKIASWSSNVEYMNTRHLPMIPVLLAIAMVVEVAGSICLVTGFYARAAAFIMFLYLTAVTVLFHNYWAFTAMSAGSPETHFRKNLAIMGGLLIIAAQGPGKWAIGRTADSTPSKPE